MDTAYSIRLGFASLAGSVAVGEHPAEELERSEPRCDRRNASPTSVTMTLASWRQTRRASRASSQIVSRGHDVRYASMTSA